MVPAQRSGAAPHANTKPTITMNASSARPSGHENPPGGGSPSHSSGREAGVRASCRLTLGPLRVFGAFILSFLASASAVGASIVQFASPAFTIEETDDFTLWHLQQVTLTCSPTPPGDGQISAIIEVRFGTAQRSDFGPDFGMNQSQGDRFPVHFPPRAAAVDFVVHAVDDGQPEPDETAELVIVGVAGDAEIGGLNRATVTIRNGRRRLSIQSATAQENYGVGLLAVWRHGDTHEPSTVNYHTLDGTARAGADYLPASGILPISASQRSNHIVVPLINNGRVDGTRNLRVVLSNPSPGAEFAPGEGQLGIRDDEIPATLDADFGLRSPDQPAPGYGPVLVLPDNKIVLAVQYPNAAHNDSGRIARLEADGTGDASFRADGLNRTPGPVTPLGVDPLGRLLAAKHVEGHDGSKPRLVRLLPDGRLDPAFSPADEPFANLDLVYFPRSRVAVQPDSRWIVSVAEGNLVRLQTDGSLDTGFRPQLDALHIPHVATTPTGENIVLVTQRQTDDSYTWVVQRLRANGEDDPSFHSPRFVPDSYNQISQMRLQRDGRILILGHFTAVDDHPRPGIARLNADGTVDTGFAPAIGWDDGRLPTALDVDPSGRVYVAGYSDVMRFDPSGALDRDWRLPDLSPASVFGPRAIVSIRDITVQGDRILISGAIFRGPFLGQTIGTLLERIRLDPPASSFEWAGLERVISEGAGTVTLTVRRAGDTERFATVQYSTADGSALAGADYEARSGVLTFAPLESEQSFAIPVIDDDDAERLEFINLSLSDPTGGAVVGSPRGRIYLADNDSFGILRLDVAGPATGFLIYGELGRRYRVERTPALAPNSGWDVVPDQFGETEHAIRDEPPLRWIWSDSIWSDSYRDEPNGFFRLVSRPH